MSAAAAPATGRGEEFPFDSFREAAPFLRRPFTAKALQWKLQVAWKDGGIAVCYIDRALVIDRLNLLVPHLWHANFEDLDRGHALCKLTVGEITREDVGEAATPKARRSDALKRAAVHFGVGVSLARVPKSRLLANAGMVTIRSKGDKFTGEITQKGLDYLRARYQDWLDTIGSETFGGPLEHGDIGDAQGDEEATDQTVVDMDTKVGLYQALTADKTLRQQRGLLAAAGVTNVPQAPTVRDIEQAVSSLSEENAEKLTTLLAATTNEVGDGL
jgi:hypothetical protein